jgi:hypothetical protein
MVSNSNRYNHRNIIMVLIIRIVVTTVTIATIITKQEFFNLRKLRASCTDCPFPVFKAILNKSHWHLSYCLQSILTKVFKCKLRLEESVHILNEVRPIFVCCRRKLQNLGHLSVCLHATTREQLSWFSWNLISEIFAKICRHIHILVKI